LLKTDNEEILVNDTTVEHRDEYKYLGFVSRATNNVAHGVDYPVAAAKKAVHATALHLPTLI